MSSLISWCGSRHRESPLTLFYSPQLTSPSFFYVNGLSGGTLIRRGAALGVWHCGPADKDPSGPPPSSCQRSLGVQSPEQKGLVCTYSSANLPGFGVYDPLQFILNNENTLIQAATAKIRHEQPLFRVFLMLLIISFIKFHNYIPVSSCTMILSVYIVYQLTLGCTMENRYKNRNNQTNNCLNK